MDLPLPLNLQDPVVKGNQKPEGKDHLQAFKLSPRGQVKGGGVRMGKKDIHHNDYIQFTEEETRKVITGKWQSQNAKPSLPDSQSLSALQQCWKNAFSSQGTCSVVKKRLNCREKNNACIISIKISGGFGSPWPWLSFAPY